MIDGRAHCQNAVLKLEKKEAGKLLTSSSILIKFFPDYASVDIMRTRNMLSVYCSDNIFVPSWTSLLNAFVKTTHASLANQKTDYVKLFRIL